MRWRNERVYCGPNENAQSTTFLPPFCAAACSTRACVLLKKAACATEGSRQSNGAIKRSLERRQPAACRGPHSTPSPGTPSVPPKSTVLVFSPSRAGPNVLVAGSKCACMLATQQRNSNGWLSGCVKSALGQRGFQPCVVRAHQKAHRGGDESCSSYSSADEVSPGTTTRGGSAAGLAHTPASGRAWKA
eukprot:scaffold1877_cov67-Phaeocystis_antarctica.AAC.8